jgi:Protein of unknown function (DUF3187)
MSSGRAAALVLAVAQALAVAATCTLPAAAAAAESYSLLGPLRERDMTPYHLTRLEMMPVESSAALGDGWTLEADLTHTNTYARSAKAADVIIARGGRKPVTRDDVNAFLAVHGDVFYLDGEFGLFAATVHYQRDRRLGFYLTLPVYYTTGGVFDSVIEGYHRLFGFPQGGRDQVARNQFRVVYRIGREEVVELGAPGSGLSDPILGARWRLLPPGSRWDLVVESAVKIATRGQGALSTGGSDLGLQLALHRAFRRQAIDLDVSVVRVGGPFPDPRVDRRVIPAYLAAYELGLSHHAAFVIQVYVSPSVFTRSNVPDLTQNKNEIVGGFRFQHGPAAWFVDIIENFIHLENTPDVGAQLGLSWKLGG